MRQTHFVEAKIEREDERRFQATGSLFARPVPLQGEQLSWQHWDEDPRTVYATIVGTLAKVPLEKLGGAHGRAKF